MHSYDINIAGPVNYYYPEGVLQSSSLIGRAGVKMDVVNGLVQGDHKRPNPIQFTKVNYNTNFNRKVLQGDYGAQVFEGHNPSNAWMFYNMPNLAVPAFSDLYDKAMSKIYDSLRGNNEIIVDLVEGSATLRMLKSAARLEHGIAAILSAMAANTRLTRGQKFLDLITQKWLEYRYGWTPLIGGLYDAFDNVMKSELSAVRTITARSGSKSLTNLAPAAQHFSYAGMPNVVHHQVHRRERRVKLTYDFVVPQSGIWDWTSLNPSGIAWELLPFSFVADWFISIGESLRALEDWWLWKTGFLGGYVTYTSLEQQSDTVQYVAKSTLQGFWDVKFASVEGAAYRAMRYKQRMIVTTLPAPRGPRFRLKLGSEKLLDSAALLHALVGKKSRQWERMSQQYTE